MKVRNMEDLDSLAARLGCCGICGFGLGKEACYIRGTGKRCFAEVVRQRVTNVQTVLATDVRECEDLGPDGTEGSCSVGILT